MKVLRLTLKKKWFDMIASGKKKEEYREIKPYWISRLNKDYDAIRLTNGYDKDSPTFLIELLEIRRGRGEVKWGAPIDNIVYILHLGEIVENRDD